MPTPVDETIRYLCISHPHGWPWYTKEQLPLASVIWCPPTTSSGAPDRCGSAKVTDPRQFKQAVVELRAWLLKYGINARHPHDPVLEEMNFFQLKMYYNFVTYPLVSKEIAPGVRDEHHAFNSQCAEFLKNVHINAWPAEFPRTRKTQFFRNILAYLCHRRLSQEGEYYIVPTDHKAGSLSQLSDEDKDSAEEYILENLGFYDLLGEDKSDKLCEAVLNHGNPYGFWKSKNQKDGVQELRFLNDILNLKIQPSKAPSAANNRRKRKRSFNNILNLQIDGAHNRRQRN